MAACSRGQLRTDWLPVTAAALDIGFLATRSQPHRIDSTCSPAGSWPSIWR